MSLIIGQTPFVLGIMLVSFFTMSRMPKPLLESRIQVPLLTFRRSVSWWFDSQKSLLQLIAMPGIGSLVKLDRKLTIA